MVVVRITPALMKMLVTPNLLGSVTLDEAATHARERKIL